MSMLDKTPSREMMPPSANANHEKRKDIGATLPAGEITNKKADWIPLRLAPFYFTRNGRVYSAEKWAEDVIQVVRHYARLPDVLPKGWEELPNAIGWLDAPKEWNILIRAGGITTSISPEWFVIHSGNRLDYTSFIIGGCATEILTGLFDAKPRPPKSYGRSEWLPSHQESLTWHAGVLRYLFSYWRKNLERELKSGAAHAMARKNTVFAPFERVTWDQWQLFAVDACAPKDKPKYHDPYLLTELHRARRPMSATGPAGEKLYSIHIAPGVASVGEQSDGNGGGASEQQKCVHWLLQLMRQFPDRRTMSREQLYQEAVRMFPTMSKRSFKACVSVALLQEPNSNWRSAGRLGKLAHK
jgi:hypothetical protein